VQRIADGEGPAQGAVASAAASLGPRITREEDTAVAGVAEMPWDCGREDGCARKVNGTVVYELTGRGGGRMRRLCWEEDVGDDDAEEGWRRAGGWRGSDGGSTGP
jgi:hypothetical protein